MKFIFFKPILIFLIIISCSQSLFPFGLIQMNDDPLQSENFIQGDKTTLRFPLLFKKDIFTTTDNFSACRREIIRAYLFYYLTFQSEYLLKSIKRSYHYLDIIRNCFQNYPEIPEDLMLLPLLESGFNPRACSRSRALGLWQFMKNTARPLKLKANKWLDERKDIKKSTYAAIKHLKYLYDSFGSWDLALAAYNGGANYIRKKLKESNAKDIWELRKAQVLNTETAEYLPKFIALLIIYKNQKLFGVPEVDFPSDIQETREISFNFPVDLKKLAFYSGMTLDLIRVYNPELNFNITPPFYKNYSLRITKEAIEELNSLNKNLYIYKYKQYRKHKIKKGESISEIAEKYNKKEATLVRVNRLKNPHLIYAGRILYIPN